MIAVRSERMIWVPLSIFSTGCPGQAVAHRVDGVVVDHRKAAGVGRGGGVAEVLLRHLAAVPERARGLHDDRAEEAGVDLPAVPLAAGRGPGAEQHMLPLALGVESVGRRQARVHQASRRVGAHLGAVVERRAGELQAVHVDRGHARGVLVAVDPEGLEQVLELDPQAVPDVHPQHQRARALFGPELDVARGEVGAAVEGDDVAPQGEHHALGLDGAQAIPEEDLIEGDDVGGEGAGAGRLGARNGGRQQGHRDARRAQG